MSSSPSSSGRAAALRDVVGRTPLLPKSPYPAPTSAYFGVNTFGARQMRDKLPKAIYEKLVASIRLGNKLDIEIAPTVAQVIKDWAISHGVTHFTHWFQPQTGLTAEKHDAFLTFDEQRQPMEKFSGAQLIQSEPDASQLPLRRPPRHVGGARLHGLESGQPGVHRRIGRRAHAVHPVGVHRLQRRSAGRDDAAAPQLGRAVGESDRTARRSWATRAFSASTPRSDRSRSTS